MESFAHYLGLLVGLFLAHKLVQAYLRCFRAVWWQGLIITLPAVFVAVIPVLWIANAPEWLQDLTFWLAFPDIIMTFERVRREQKAADVSHS